MNPPPVNPPPVSPPPGTGGGFTGVVLPVGEPWGSTWALGWLVSQGFGVHLGLDLSRPGDTDVRWAVYAPGTGVIETIETDAPGWGGVLVIRITAPPGSPFRLPSGGTTTVVRILLGHMAPSPTLRVGDTVEAGSVVGTVEPLRPGVNSTGPHLHVEVIVDMNVTLPGPGYSSDPLVQATRTDPAIFFDANTNLRQPAPVTRMVSRFSSAPMDVAAIDAQRVVTSVRGTGAADGSVVLVDVTTNSTTILASGLGLPAGIDATGGTIYVAVQREGRVLEVSNLLNSPTVRELASGLVFPSDVVKIGNTLIVAETGLHRLVSIDLTTRTVTPFAGQANQPGHDGDGGGPLAARFTSPTFLTARNGVVFIEDGGDRLRMIAGGVVQTLALSRPATLDAMPVLAPTGLAFDYAGDLWAADSRQQVCQVVGSVVVPALGVLGVGGNMGGAPSDVRLSSPWGISWTPLGLIICDGANNELKLYPGPR